MITTRATKTRRWYQFSLRSLVLCAMLTGPLLGLYGPRLHTLVQEALAPAPEEPEDFSFFIGMAR